MSRILIVDDEEPFREILAAMLNHCGSYECRLVPSGVEALRLLDAGQKFDLITCDIMNFPMDGFEFLKQMGWWPILARFWLEWGLFASAYSIPF